MSNTFIPKTTLGFAQEEMYKGKQSIIERHKEIFKPLMYFFNKDVIVNYNNGVTDNGRKEMDTISINLWSGHKDAEMTFPESDECFGIKFCSDGIFVPSPDLLSIADVLEYDKDLNKIFFLYDVCEFETEEEYKLLTILVNELLIKIAGDEKTVKDKIKETEDGIVTAKMNKLAGKVVEGEKQKSSDRKRRIEENRRKLEDYRRQIRQLSLTVQTDEAMLVAGDSMIDKIKENIVKELEIMKANQKIIALDIEENGLLEITTAPIYCNVLCEDKKVRKYFFGQYKIRVNIGNGDVKFFNQMENMRRYSVWSERDQHPHVGNNGSGCLGSASTLIADCIDQYQWGALADILINYLESVNIDDSAGRKYINWDELDEEGNVVTGDKKYKGRS